MIREESSEDSVVNTDLSAIGERSDLVKCEQTILRWNLGKNSCATGIIMDELPSKVNDRKEIFFPSNLNLSDPRIYGKWMWFTNGNRAFQDNAWIDLSQLIVDGKVILLESSTFRKPDQRGGMFPGVISCYTCEDKMAIKQAGLAIRKILNDETILFYKKKEALVNTLVGFGDEIIAEHMLTVSGKFYKRDNLGRWMQVNDSEEICESRQSPDVQLPPRRLLGMDCLPSIEFSELRYSYPFQQPVQVHEFLWSLYCDVTDFDGDGLTELDRAWAGAMQLCDEGYLQHTLCETFAAEQLCFSRRSMSCVVGKFCSLDQIVKSGEN